VPYMLIYDVDTNTGHAVAQLIRRTALHASRSWVRFPMGSLGIFIDLILLAALWP